MHTYIHTYIHTHNYTNGFSICISNTCIIVKYFSTKPNALNKNIPCFSKTISDYSDYSSYVFQCVTKTLLFCDLLISYYNKPVKRVLGDLIVFKSAFQIPFMYLYLKYITI